jgi:hypothetical protein
MRARCIAPKPCIDFFGQSRIELTLFMLVHHFGFLPGCIANADVGAGRAVTACHAELFSEEVPLGCPADTIVCGFVVASSMSPPREEWFVALKSQERRANSGGADRSKVGLWLHGFPGSVKRHCTNNKRRTS